MTTNWRRHLLVQLNSNQTVPAKQLAAEFSVSTRTIRNYIATLNDELGGAIESSHQGYRLKTSVREGLNRLEAATPSTLFTPLQRREYIIQSCLTSADNIDLYELSADLFVSDATIEADLVKLRTVLNSNGLSLLRHGSKIRIEGPELNKRRLLRRAVVRSIAAHPQSLDDRLIAQAMHEPRILHLRQFVLTSLNAHGFTVNDNIVDNLVAHIAVLVQRLRDGYSVDFSIPVTVPEEAKPLVETLANAINERFSVDLPEVEIRYLAFLVIENAIPEQISLSRSSSPSPFFEDKYVALVQTTVRQIAEKYFIDLNNDRFVAFLSLHIRNLVQRAERKEVASPPAGLSIRNTHPMVYEIAVFIAHRIRQELGVVVAEDEISLISFHVGAHFRQLQNEIDKVQIAVDVPNYYEVRQQLITAIRTHVGERASVTLARHEDDQNWNRSDPDILVTAVPPVDTSNVPTVLVSAFPTDEELARIDAVVAEQAMLKRRSRTLSVLVDLFDPQLFTINEANERLNRKQVVRRLASRLEVNGAINGREEYVEAVDEREAMSPTCFASQAAIPHSMHMEANNSAIAVCISRTSIDWDGKPVQFVAMLAFSESFRKAVSEVFDDFIHTIVTRENVEYLVRASSSYETFIQALVPLLEK